ncbi:TM0996/MTH895 family glutaredoxin-like protein [Tissierella carlieri]|uniref:Thioredoxin family protein n=1 Tax=Tissierella carlieri TaxID=689904 RepID=A0ABT1SCE4_9FIRM|nr:thioredoxin family protein [Tissierella carlieri]MBU5313740.1 TM0996/MTH895 family glutaredoxin-like protein [Tissierella carlieri]MCQ4924136.1 thioredoxin family protein [Tissierella carlieri]
MIIKILGAGCDKCDKSYDNAVKAAADLGIEVKIEKVEDLITMMKYGIITTPGIVVDEKVVMVGRVPKVEEFKSMIRA